MNLFFLEHPSIYHRAGLESPWVLVEGMKPCLCSPLRDCPGKILFCERGGESQSGTFCLSQGGSLCVSEEKVTGRGCPVQVGHKTDAGAQEDGKTESRPDGTGEPSQLF